jgi:hypothetical protein
MKLFEKIRKSFPFRLWLWGETQQHLESGPHVPATGPKTGSQLDPTSRDKVSPIGLSPYLKRVHSNRRLSPFDSLMNLHSIELVMKILLVFLPPTILGRNPYK